MLDTQDERTTAQGLFNYGDSYLVSAHLLNDAGLNVAFPESPARFLLYHAAELYLKSYLRCTGIGIEDLKKIGHRFTKLVRAASASGLGLDNSCEAIFVYGERTGDVMDSRYIRTGYRKWYPTELLGKCTAQIRQAVRLSPARKGEIILRGEKTGFVDDACEKAWGVT
jgi:HEPN domain-containing protein